MHTEPEDDPRGAELRQLLEAIQSGAIEDFAALDEAQLALLREHLSDEELEALFDRAAEGEPD